MTPNSVCFWNSGEGHRRPAYVGRQAPWFQGVGRDQVNQSLHGRDGHALFSRDFKGSLS
jgi:hypothetical protein